MKKDRVIFYTGETAKKSQALLRWKNHVQVDFVTEFLSAAIQILVKREHLQDPYVYEDFQEIFNSHTLILLDVWQIDAARASTMKFFLFLIKGFLQAEKQHRILFVSEGSSEIINMLVAQLQEFHPKIIEVR